MRIYTRKGDDGTTGLHHGGRVAKSSALPQAYGSVDEAQAAIGLARAYATRADELDGILLAVERDLWILMAELATDPARRDRLVAGRDLVTAEMVVDLEHRIDAVSERFELPTEFVVPGETLVAAHLDHARTVVRRAERDVIAAVRSVPAEVFAESFCVAYLNRLSDLLWTLARWQEGSSRPARSTPG